MIYVEDQLVKVNGVVLPGLVKSIEVKESAKIDEQEVEGSATKPKQATGYEDAKITVELILDDTPTRTKYQALEAVRAIFRKPGQTVPQPIPIVSEDTAGGSGGKSSGSSGSSATSSGLSEDYKSYLATDRGVSPVARDALSGAASSAVSMIAKMLPE